MSTRAFTGIVGADASRDLEYARAQLALLPNDYKQAIATTSAEQLTSAWKQELESRRGYSRSQHHFVTEDARVVAHNQGFNAYTGAGLARQFEFGALHREKFKTYLSRRGSTTFQVKRRTKRQMPSRSQTGWIAYPAAAAVANRAARLWAQIIRRRTHEALERGK